MQESGDVRDTMLRYYEAAGNADFDAADSLVTRGDVAIVVGTGPGEGLDDRDAWVAGFRSQVEALPGVRIEPGTGPRGYAEGSVGWFLDEKGNDHREYGDVYTSAAPAAAGGAGTQGERAFAHRGHVFHRTL